MSAEKESHSQPPPSSIVILGPRIEDSSSIFTITEAVKNNGTVLGNGEKDKSGNLSLPAISDSLKNSTSTTHIHYFMHGNIIRQEGPHQGKHILDFANQGYTDGGPYFISTVKLFERDKDQPGIRHVWACHCGAATDAVKMLGDGVPAIFHSGSSDTTLSGICTRGIVRQHEFSQKSAKEGKPPNAYDAFELSMMTSPETCTIAEMRNGEVKSFTARPPDRCLSDKGTALYLNSQLQYFRKFRERELGHQRTDFRQDMPQLASRENIEHYRGETLIIAANRGNLEYVKTSLDYGMSPDYTLQSSSSPLHLACSGGQDKVATLLLEKGANPNLIAGGSTPLHAACQKGHESTVKLLLDDHRIDPNTKATDGATPLYTACENGNKNIARLLLDDARTNPDMPGKSGLTPLYATCLDGRADIADMLLQRGANPDTVPNTTLRGVPPLLIVACEKGDQKMVDTLLTHNVNTNVTADNGIPPLYIASQEGHGGIVDTLLARRANPNAQIYNGTTPLYAASQWGHEPVVAKLLENGADPHIAKHDGTTPLMIAQEKGHHGIAEKISARIDALQQQHSASSQQGLQQLGMSPEATAQASHLGRRLSSSHVSQEIGNPAAHHTPRQERGDHSMNR